MPHSCRAVCRKKDELHETLLQDLTVNIVGDVLELIIRQSKPSRGLSRMTGSFPEKWMHALCSSSHIEPDELSRQVREWRRPLSLSLEASFKLCLRLE